MPARGECELVMQQLILQNDQLFTSGSEVKIIRRAKVKNMLQSSTQSIHLTAQLAENAQLLTRESSNTLSELELKISKDPRENELLQAVYGTLKRKQAIRTQTSGKQYLGSSQPSESPPFVFSPPSSESESIISPYRLLPRPPSPPSQIGINDNNSTNTPYIPSTLPLPPNPPSTAKPLPAPPSFSYPSSSPSLSFTPRSPNSSPTASLALSLDSAKITTQEENTISKEKLKKSSSEKLQKTSSEKLQKRSNEKYSGKAKDKNSQKIEEKSQEKPQEKSQEKSQSKTAERLLRLFEKPREKAPDIPPEKPNEKQPEKSQEKSQEKSLAKTSAEKPTGEKLEDEKKAQEQLEKPQPKPTCEALEDEKTQEQRNLEKLLEKPWPKPPPLPPYRLSRRISALRKFDRDRSSKKNSKPPIDIFEGEKEKETSQSFRVRMANLRNMFEKTEDSPKLPTSNSKLFTK